MDYLLLRSASLGLPLDADGVISGAGDWEESDVAALEDLTNLELTPGDGYTTVRGQVGGRDYTGYVIALTVGRMAPLPIPEKMLPWQVIGDPSGEPLEWSERIKLKTKGQTLRSLRRLTDRIESQFDHYTVEHDQVPPQELAEQHALAQRAISDIEEDHSGLSVRTEGWYRVARRRLRRRKRRRRRSRSCRRCTRRVFASNTSTASTSCCASSSPASRWRTSRTADG